MVLIFVIYKYVSLIYFTDFRNKITDHSGRNTRCQLERGDLFNTINKKSFTYCPQMLFTNETCS